MSKKTLTLSFVSTGVYQCKLSKNSAEVGRVNNGQVFELMVSLSYEQHELIVPRVLLRLDQPTTDGETEIAVLTNLPQTSADGPSVAQLYRERWTVERLFQVITETLNCEIKSLGYPKAALLSFSMALVAYNVLSVVKTALRAVHGVGLHSSGAFRLLPSSGNPGH